MRVLHVLNSIERSGMELMLITSANEWKRHGYSCDVVAIASGEGPAAPAMRAAGYRLFHIPFRSRYRFLPRAGFLRDFYRLCHSRYDVVHIHVETATALFAILALAAGSRRIAVTPHSTFRFIGNVWFRKRMERWIIRHLGGRYGMISDSVRKCEMEEFGNTGVRVQNWIDTEHFRPPSQAERAEARRDAGLQPTETVVVSIGNCEEVKNHGSLLRALAQIPETQRPAYIHVGREDKDASEHALASALGIADRVRFTGSLADVRPVLWAADLYVMPSLREGFGMSAVEAIACGVPVVFAKVDGLVDIAVSTKWAVLTETTPESIGKEIMAVLSLPADERQVRARDDSRRVRQQFSVENGVASIVENLYASR
jgi:glycosyltransferase involved in cell wall biosynthesis